MFAKKKDGIYTGETSTQSIETIIGEGAVIEGVITSKTALRLDGQVIGDIKSTGSVIIGASGKLDGTVEAAELLIAGNIQGNVTVSGKTEFVSGGYLNGDLVTGGLVVEQGAAFDGTCKTVNNAKLPRLAEAKPESRAKAEAAT